MAVRQRRSGEGWGRGGARGYRPRARQNLPARGEPGLGHTDAGRRENVRVECGMCLADWARALAGCGAQVGAPGPSCRPACNARRNDSLLPSSNRAAGDSQPPAHRLGTTQDPAGDAPAEGRVARWVNHALIDPLIQFLCSRAVSSPRLRPAGDQDL